MPFDGVVQICLSNHNRNFIIMILLTQLFFIFLLIGSSLEIDDPVAFTAIKGSLNGNYIAFQAVIVNNNADFTSSYGAFKTTRPGTYFFTFTAISPEGSDLRISLRSNGVPVVTIYSGGSTSYNSASGSGLLSLEEGDLVYLYVEKGELYESNRVNRAYTTFSGF